MSMNGGRVFSRPSGSVSNVSVPQPAMSNKVLASLESEDGTQCVDFFVREDGMFGFEQFRSEYDGSSRWQSLGRSSRLSFASGEDALRAAKLQVSWLGGAQVWRW